MSENKKIKKIINLYLTRKYLGCKIINNKTKTLEKNSNLVKNFQRANVGVRLVIFLDERTFQAIIK